LKPVQWPRVGIGYDVHRFADGRKLIIGGVEIPHDQGLDGHSDADVLLHAIADAILGAAALGDIGIHFPPTNEKFRGIDSRDILRHSIKLIGESGWSVVNIDATIVAEAPKLMPHANAMREVIATDTGITVDDVSVKATTNELMGFVGRGEGIAAIATVMIAPST
jgi:2-C-methyl-D-erythritol 2,4-cyclodiphosphate synthase